MPVHTSAPLKFAAVDASQLSLGELKVNQYKMARRNLLHKGRTPFTVVLPRASRVDLRSFRNDHVAYCKFEGDDFDRVKNLTESVDELLKDAANNDPDALFGAPVVGEPEFKGAVVGKEGYDKQLRVAMPVRSMPKLRKNEFNGCAFYTSTGKELSFADVMELTQSKPLIGTPTVEFSHAWAMPGGKTANANPTADAEDRASAYGYKLVLRAFVLADVTKGDADEETPLAKKLKFEDVLG